MSKIELTNTALVTPVYTIAKDSILSIEKITRTDKSAYHVKLMESPENPTYELRAKMDSVVFGTSALIFGLILSFFPFRNFITTISVILLLIAVFLGLFIHFFNKYIQKQEDAYEVMLKKWKDDLRINTKSNYDFIILIKTVTGKEYEISWGLFEDETPPQEFLDTYQRICHWL